jgi:hypothetical protein
MLLACRFYSFAGNENKALFTHTGQVAPIFAVNADSGVVTVASQLNQEWLPNEYNVTLFIRDEALVGGDVCEFYFNVTIVIVGT